MRKAARTDGTQQAIVSALREAGASVEILAQCGKGVPDLLVGVSSLPFHFSDGNRRLIVATVKSINFLIEVKDPTKPKRDQKLTPDQERWHANWKGQVAVVHTVEEALRVIGALQ